MNEIIITDHAYEKAKERLSLKKKSFERLASKAYELGTNHKETSGRLNKYITSKWSFNKNANNIKIYGQNIFIFCNNILVTIYRIPNNLLKQLG